MAKNLVDGASTTIEENADNISIQINFPIGYIYMSTSSTDPSTYFGGTWQRIAKGRTLVGVDENDTDFDTASEIGGEKTHTLTVQEMPSHKHDLKWTNEGNTGSGYGTLMRNYDQSGGYAYQTGSKGGDQAHNNLQPYFTCYIWEKVGA